MTFRPVCRYKSGTDEQERNGVDIEIKMKEEEKMKFFTANRETGTFIDEFDTYEEAKKAIEEYEEQDKTDGIYEADFYEIEDENHCPIEI